MLIFDLRTIGNRLYAIRKRRGMTQLDVAVAAGLSERTYADIERGETNMRVETVMRICQALNVTPDDFLTADSPAVAAKQEEVISLLSGCSAKEKETAIDLLMVYLRSLEQR